MHAGLCPMLARRAKLLPSRTRASTPTCQTVAQSQRCRSGFLHPGMHEMPVGVLHLHCSSLESQKLEAISTAPSQCETTCHSEQQTRLCSTGVQVEAGTEVPEQTAEEAVQAPGSCASQEDSAEEPAAAPGAPSAIFIRTLTSASLTADL